MSLAKKLAGLVDRWNSQSLASQFLLVGGLFSILVMVVVGLSVTKQIEAVVTRNSASTTALYVDSVIAPLLPDMRKSAVLDDSVRQALDETLGHGALGGRLEAFRLWRRDGTILYSTDKSLIGTRVGLNDNLKAAFAGQMVSEFNRLNDVESQAERASGLPLLEIYNPVLQPWSGEVVAVSEFYEVATDFEQNLRQALIRSWLDVGLATTIFFLGLSAIVFRASRTIRTQSHSLKQRIGELSALVSQNKALRLRVQRASQRVTGLNERYLRRIGTDLHDGPAQLVALAALGLDSPVLCDPETPASIRESELLSIKSNLDEAMREIRSISNGLILPHIETAEVPQILTLAVRSHETRTKTKVAMSLSERRPKLTASAKICLYRFTQEALNNGFRHTGGARQSLTETIEGDHISIEVADAGPGFDPAAVPPERLGLVGLRERVESLGGRFEIQSSRNGTKVRMSLDIGEMVEL